MKNENPQNYLQQSLNGHFDRKNFLKYAALAGGGLMLGLESCKKNTPVIPPPTGTIDVGAGDIGILNFAYALEQIEAAFYIKVNEHLWANTTIQEKLILFDIMNHEIIHREFFKAALGKAAIPELKFNFSSVNFNSRASVLGTSKALEDTGVSAYNGAGAYIQSGDYLLLAGKIVSVEARHASTIRDLLNPKSKDFAGDDVVNISTALEMSRTPNEGSPSIVQIANTFLTTKISATQLP